MQCPNCNHTVQTHRNPVPTVDIIIEYNNGIVLIERKNPPHGWALPGGFVDYGESLEVAAAREAKEETNLEVRGLQQFKAYSDPTRDSRLHTISVVFCGQGHGILSAGDDAAKARVFSRTNLPPLAFDHDQILSDYFATDKS